MDAFLNAASTRRSEAEVAIVERLLAHPPAHGGELGWGKGVTPGVTGWYQVDGQKTAVWNLNLNYESPTARAYMYFYLADLVKRRPIECIEESAAIPLVNILDGSEDSRGAKVRMGQVPLGLPSGRGRDAVQVESIFRAINVLADTA